VRENRYALLQRVRCVVVVAGEARVFIDGREFGRVLKIRVRHKGKECWRWTAETMHRVRLDIREHERVYAARALVMAVLDGKVPTPPPLEVPRG
jgi:hypothetical protein